jgi:hypothetical protein
MNKIKLIKKNETKCKIEMEIKMKNSFKNSPRVYPIFFVSPTE